MRMEVYATGVFGCRSGERVGLHMMSLRYGVIPYEV